MSTSLALFSELVSGIYDASLDASLWQQALSNLVGAFDGECAALLIHSRKSSQALHASVGQDHASVDSYNAYYGQMDPFASAIEQMPAGNIFRYGDIVAPGLQRRSEFFCDWAVPNNIGDGVFASLVRDEDRIAWLGIGWRSRLEPADDDEKARLMRLLVPHMQQALRVQSSLGVVASQQRGTLRSLNRMAHGLVLFAENGAVLFANRAMERIAATDDGLALAAGSLCVMRRDENATLQRLISRAAGRTAGGPRESGTLTVTRPSARPPFVVHVVPTETGAEEFPTVGAMAVIVDIERQPRDLASMLRNIYGLTRAESTVACEVVRGVGLQSVADNMSITLSTVRIHLQRIFEKTHTHRQAELARLLLTIEAAVEPYDGLP
ncbi:helix-turn-helix transcriptional regulator [Mesorhizobium sp. IMUNJ 23232]|uniref:helix-turn-helix transcriptional regulator n=1 Tax=Mesorhizobium sp. IMUNJ 23232 TaxID=3376064 RepID=UPI00378B5A36